MGILAVMLVASARGQHDAYDFCAVRVFATDDDGRPVVSAAAELVDPSGRAVQTEKVVNGRAEFCDFGFGAYSIFIHYNETQCAATEIRNIHVIYGLTQNFRAVLNYCADEADIGPGTACMTYVRVTSQEEGRPLKAVEIKGGQTRDSEYTDTYGRARVLVGKGTHLDFAFLKPGYKPVHLVLSCSPLLEGRKEASVVLQPEERMKE